MTGKTFPIMLDLDIKSIPYGLMVKHQAQLARNHGGRTVEEKANRGGLTPEEAVAVIEGREFERMGFAAARDRLRQLVREYEAPQVDPVPAGHVGRTLDGLKRAEAVIKLSGERGISLQQRDDMLLLLRDAQVSVRALAARVAQ